MEIRQEIQFLNLAIQAIDFKTDELQAKTVLGKLLNLVETLYQENLRLREEIQRLKDEIARLKGEKGKPDIKASCSKNGANGSSTSDAEKSPIGQSPRKEWCKSSKLKQIEIDEEIQVHYEGKLPSDAQRKGYRAVVIQGIDIKRHNVRYLLEQYYSPSERRTHGASLPVGVYGEFSAELKAFVIYFHHDCRMTQPKILQFLNGRGIKISSGQISNLLSCKHSDFHAEKDKIIHAGIQSSIYQHIDDTSARVMGVNQYFIVLCNEYFSAFFIRPKKTRLTILEILNEGKSLRYTVNGATLEYLKGNGLPRHILDALFSIDWPQGLMEEDFTAQIEKLCPLIRPRYMRRIREAAAISWYHEGHSRASIKILSSDAAKQYSGITTLNALCWVHEERHYKKLMPLFDKHKDLVKEFRGFIWEYYRKLENYKRFPDSRTKTELEKEFDKLFSTQSGYDALDDCIINTRSRKAGLLVVLDYPKVPLHNNPAELAVREYVIKRNISLQNRSEEGARCWETFLSIKDTCRKLGVNFYDYLLDRIGKQFQMPSLESLIMNCAIARTST